MMNSAIFTRRAAGLSLKWSYLHAFSMFWFARSASQNQSLATYMWLHSVVLRLVCSQQVDATLKAIPEHKYLQDMLLT